MKIRLSKSFLDELEHSSLGTQDKKTKTIKAILLRGVPTKTGISVEVNQLKSLKKVQEANTSSVS